MDRGEGCYACIAGVGNHQLEACPWREYLSSFNTFLPTGDAHVVPWCTLVLLTWRVWGI